MKQVLQNLRNGQISVEDIPAPTVTRHTALVQNAFSLVSAGTERMIVEFGEKNLAGKALSRPDLVRQVLDKTSREGLIPTLQSVFNRLDQPMTLGYSCAGTILEVGESLQGFNPGDRVACGGAGHAVHAEVIAVPQNLMVKLPDTVSFEQAAFTTLGTVAMHGFRLAEPQVGETVAVIGLGLLGLLAAQIARAAGCKVIGIEPNPSRTALGNQLGLTTCSPDDAEETSQQFTKGLGLDVILICADTSSSDPVNLAASIARDRARVIAVGSVGMEITRKQFYEKEILFRVSRSYGPGRYDFDYEEKGRNYPAGYIRWTEQRNMQAFVDLLGDRSITVEPLISHTFAIEDATSAYELILGKNGTPYLGVLLKYPQKQPSELTLRKVSLQPGFKLEPTSNQLVAGVLGAGNYAQAVFLPVLAKAKKTVLHTIVSGSGVSANRAAKKYGFLHASSDENEVFQNQEINTAVVLTQHDHHARQVLAALENGKHVYCEKPLALDMDNLQAIFDLVSQKNLCLMVGFNRRFAPLAQKLKEFVTSVNEPKMVSYRVNAGALPANHWLHDPQRGGGRLLGEACHFIDFVTFLVGENPLSLDVSALPGRGIYPPDNFTLRLVYPDGSIGVVNYLANGDRSFPKEYCEVFSGGKIGILDDFHRLTLVNQGKKQIHRSQMDKGQRNAWQAFTSAITSGSEPPIPYPELLSTSQAAILASQASTNGEKVFLQ
jgi:predicted dehydrogenase/threonine dehydrogenase-like Zn-dependent dehydrogenase